VRHCRHCQNSRFRGRVVKLRLKNPYREQKNYTIDAMCSGLVPAKHLSERHGGEIRIRSTYLAWQESMEIRCFLTKAIFALSSDLNMATVQSGFCGAGAVIQPHNPWPRDGWVGFTYDNGGIWWLCGSLPPHHGAEATAGSSVAERSTLRLVNSQVSSAISDMFQRCDGRWREKARPVGEGSVCSLSSLANQTSTEPRRL
jgi:hypothetical protein